MSPHPPKLALKIFRWFCNPRIADGIEGDMVEEYRKRVERVGKRKADIRFYKDVFLLMRPDIIRKEKTYQPTTNYGMFKTYFTIGWRNILRDKGYSLINIGGLAMGIAVTLLIGMWIHDELSFDKDNRQYDRVARVIQNLDNNNRVETWSDVPFPLSDEIRKNYGADFKRIAMAINWGDHIVSFEEKKFKMTGAFFENDGPKLMDLKMLKGASDFNDPASIILSQSMADAYFANEDPINQILKVDDYPVVKVIGVYEDMPANSSFSDLKFVSSYDLVYANSPWMKTSEDPWRPNFVALFVELTDNADIHSASLRIKDAKLKRLSEVAALKKPELFLLPMSDWHLRSEYKNGVNTGGAIEYVWMFGVIGSFVLLLACINFMNLSTARSERRAKEVGVRKAIGSKASQVTQQFFCESFLTVTLAFVLAIEIARIALPLFNSVANKNLELAWTNPLFWFTCFALIFITAFVAGSYPAFYLSSFKPIKVLKGSFKAGKFASIPRKVLVVTQFTVSVALIIGTVIVYQQIQFTKNRPVGYSRTNLVSIPTMNGSIHDHFESIKDELAKTGVITSMAESQSPPTGIWSSSSGLSWPGKDPAQSINFGVVFASPEFGNTIEWELKEGRGFQKDSKSDSTSIVLNEAAVDFMNLKDPVGQELKWWDMKVTVIGVVKNMVVTSPYAEAQPVVYAPLEEAGGMVLAKLNPDMNTTEALSKIETTFKKINTEQPFEFQFVDQVYAKKFSDEERIGKLAGVFTTLAVIISCLGIFGLASFTAEQRSKEIGIRKVLGASVATLWKLLAQEFVLLVGISCVVAIPLAYYFVHEWLLNYNYHTHISWVVFVVTAIGALAITMVTISYQAVKTAVANPIKALRSE